MPGDFFPDGLLQAGDQVVVHMNDFARGVIRHIGLVETATSTYFILQGGTSKWSQKTWRPMGAGTWDKDRVTRATVTEVKSVREENDHYNMVRKLKHWDFSKVSNTDLRQILKILNG